MSKYILKEKIKFHLLNILHCIFSTTHLEEEKTFDKMIQKKGI